MMNQPVVIIGIGELAGVFARGFLLIDGMVNGINGDPDHKCTGRSAPARLEGVIELANCAGLDIPKIREIYSKLRRD
jgi:hypothetical protein